MTIRRIINCLAFALAPVALAAPGDDLLKAPPSFAQDGRAFIPVDFQAATLDLVFDTTAPSAHGVATIRFYASESGYPILDLVPDAVAVRLNGVAVAAPGLLTMQDPAKVTTMRAVNAPVAADSLNTLEIVYTLDPRLITVDAAGARAGFFMTDLKADGRGYLEQYAPTNLLFDQYPLSVKARVVGDVVAHRLYTNGWSRQVDVNVWEVQYPAHFTAQSFYFHLTDKPMRTVSGRVRGEAAIIPFTIYAEAAVDVERALPRAQRVLDELEADYGSYGHDHLTIYVTPTGGGMEYNGATMTSLGALEHELTHSWFARGVQHADGNSGWIDEAIASWRDDGYPRATTLPNRAPVNLGALPAYQRNTSIDAYGLGAQFMSELDLLLHGGLKATLRQLFERFNRKTINNLEFQSHLNEAFGGDLSVFFDRYVFGVGDEEMRPPLASEQLESGHPRAYTDEELRRYR